jgi:hypothetical protein
MRSQNKESAECPVKIQANDIPPVVQHKIKQKPFSKQIHSKIDKYVKPMTRKAEDKKSKRQEKKTTRNANKKKQRTSPEKNVERRTTEETRTTSVKDNQ